MNLIEQNINHHTDLQELTPSTLRTPLLAKKYNIGSVDMDYQDEAAFNGGIGSAEQ